MKYNYYFRTLVWILVVTTAAVCLFVACGVQPTAGKSDASQPVPYKILSDEMGFTIRIGVGADVNEEQLRLTLGKAATDHQDDAARDYLMREHLLVEAYLERAGQVSSKLAGLLRRYVPPRNPESRADTRTEQDSFIITLDEAKRTLP